MKHKQIIVVFLIILFSNCDRNYQENELNYDQLQIKADSMFDSDKYQDALEFYDRLLMQKKEPKNYCARAFCKSSLNDYKGAIDDYLVAIKLEYKEDTCYFNIALCYGLMGEDSLEIDYLHKVLEINPNMDDAKTVLEFFKNNKKLTR